MIRAEDYNVCVAWTDCNSHLLTVSTSVFKVLLSFWPLWADSEVTFALTFLMQYMRSINNYHTL